MKLNECEFCKFYFFFTIYCNISNKVLTATVGCLATGHFGDAFGTRLTFRVAALFWITGILILALVKYISVIVLARVATGIAMGLLSCTIPVYITEVIPRAKRGKAISMVQLGSVVGTIAIFYLSSVLQIYLPDEYSFKITWACEAVPALFVVGLTALLPESPRWLLAKGKWAEAAKVLEKLPQMKKVLPDDSTPCSYSELFKKAYFQYTVCGALTQLFTQATCISSLSYFFSYLCAMCGIEGNHRLWMVSVQYIIGAFFTCFPLSFLDRTRRKDSLVFGMIVLSLGFSSMAVLILLYETSAAANSSMRWSITNKPASAILALFLFVTAVYSALVVSVSWLYVAELFPRSIRNKGSSLCISVSWMMNAVLNIMFPYVFKMIRGWIFVPIALICLVGGIIIMQFPETRDLVELEIQLPVEEVKRPAGVYKVEEAEMPNDNEQRSDFYDKKQEHESAESVTKHDDADKESSSDLESVVRYTFTSHFRHADYTSPDNIPRDSPANSADSEDSTSVEEVIQAYEADSGSPYSQDSYYSHDWDNSPDSIEHSASHGDTSFLHFDTLRVSLKSLVNHHQNQEHALSRKKGAGLNANL